MTSKMSPFGSLSDRRGSHPSDTGGVVARVAHVVVDERQLGLLVAWKRTDEGFLIDFPLSRQDIAEMTGTTLHTVSRLMTAWEEKGLVRSGRQKVTVVDQHRLLALAEGRTERS